MLMRKLLAMSVMALVLTFAGFAFPGNTVEGPVSLEDFDQAENLLLGYPSGVPPMTTFVRDHHTQHLPSLIDPNLFPPDPCRGLAQAWDAVILSENLHGHAQRQVLGILLQIMAADQCKAIVGRNPATNPPTITTIRPSP